MKLTETNFWDEYWAKYELPCVVNMNFPFDRALSRTFKEILKRDSSKSIFEIGCAPGKWLIFFKKEFSYEVFGLEYSQVGVKKSLENFALHNIEGGHIYKGDFFNIQADRQFDIVVSLGFIEHFYDVNSIVAKHIEWLKPGGQLILGVPNFRGINYSIQRILDDNIIGKHNLKIMNESFFEGLTQRFSLNLQFFKYCCSFEPALFIPKKGNIGVAQFIVRGLLLVARNIRRFQIWDHMNSRFFSSYIVSVYEKVVK